ncbi:tyrosine-type recombinase/integrase [Dyella sp. Tek66A03]|uniref:tyrosine-type recombinase/integrase n=1 Tax=Dyella sp. Tek66A03 TaxID=3458298 RepID=UPI00403E9716
MSMQPNGRPLTPWNRGRVIGQKLPLKLRDIFGVRVRLQLQRRIRDLALFNLAIDSKLRGCDLVALRVCDLAREGGLGARAQIIQRKTGKTVQFELTEQTRRAIMDWINRRCLTREDYLFPSRQRPEAHLSTRQYARIVKRWVASAGLQPSDYGTHSMRRTKPTLIYRRTHNLRAIQLLLGHTKLESTVRYLGIEVEDALALSEETEV